MQLSTSRHCCDDPGTGAGIGWQVVPLRVFFSGLTKRLAFVAFAHDSQVKRSKMVSATSLGLTTTCVAKLSQKLGPTSTGWIHEFAAKGFLQPDQHHSECIHMFTKRVWRASWLPGLEKFLVDGVEASIECGCPFVLCSVAHSPEPQNELA